MQNMYFYFKKYKIIIFVIVCTFKQLVSASEENCSSACEHPKFVQEHAVREKRCWCPHVPNLIQYMMRSNIPTQGVAFEAAQSCSFREKKHLPKIAGFQKYRPFSENKKM